MSLTDITGGTDVDSLAAVFHLFPASVLILDHGGRVRQANAAAIAMLGTAVQPGTLDTLVEIEPGFVPLQPLIAGAEADVQRAFEFHSERLQRDYTLVVTGFAGGFVVVLHDITDLLDQGSFREEMLRLASHDLRSPLALILSYCELLMLDMPESLTTAMQYVSVIRLAAEKMKALLDAILDVERLRTMPLDLQQIVDPAAMVRAAVDNMRALAAHKNQHLALETQAGMGTLLVDVLFVQEAMENYIGNAIKYTPAGGRLTVHAYARDGRFHFVVEDNGIGIGPGHLEHIFEAFYRAKQPGTESIEGTGLGLSLVKAAIERHQGKVWVESEEGKGSRFGFWLPFEKD